VPIELDDEIMPHLDPYEQSILRRLYRLSHGFERITTDPVSFTKLASMCKMGKTKTQAVIRSLEARKLIRIIGGNRKDPAGGNRYEVLANIAAERHSRGATMSQDDIINDDDLNYIDDHQSKTMRIYQEVTRNSWTKADRETYQEISEVPIQAIEQGIRLAANRAKTTPNSLAYFKAEILRQVTPQQSRSQQKQAIKEIVDRYRNLKAGSRTYTIADLCANVKEACLKEGVAFNDDLFSEIIGLG
jgi:hypothetical protein